MENLTLPFGFKYVFEPTDPELLVYLSRKANGEPLPCEKAIREIDLYDLVDPGKLFHGTDEDEIVYVFTKLKKVSGDNGKRAVDRSVTGNLMWKGGQLIYDSKGCQIGEKKKFVLINKMNTMLGYNMKEFTLDKDALRNSKFKDYVVCKIKKKDQNNIINSSDSDSGEGFGQNHG